MGHSHAGHTHTHHHSLPNLQAISRAFYVGILLNTLYMLVEFVVGFRSDSLALVSDASHNLSDVASLIISLLGMKLAQRATTRNYTYGYKKASVLASLINAILLVFIVVKIGREAFFRLTDPPQVPATTIMITAALGVVINTLSAFLFYKGQKQDINIKGAFLHLLVDALVSVGVILSGVVMYFTQWYWVDMAISVLICVVIVLATWSLLCESLKLILDGVPQQINTDEIKKIILQHPKVASFHHLHLWALSSSENALTVHLVLQEDTSFKEVVALKEALRHQLWHQKVHHTTFEIEYQNEPCHHLQCNSSL